MDRMRRHAERFNTAILFDHINRVELRQRPFRLFGDNGEYTCDALIIATVPRPSTWASSPSRRFAARSIGVRDLRRLFYRGKAVAVVGGATPRWRKLST